MTSFITSASTFTTSSTITTTTAAAATINRNTSCIPGLNSAPNVNINSLPPLSTSYFGTTQQQQQPSALLQQQYPQAISSISSSKAQLHQNQLQTTQPPNDSLYNGIFLVDGLGSGIRIDTNNRAMASGSSPTMTMTMTEPSSSGSSLHHQYGLPSTHSLARHPNCSSSSSHPIAMPQACLNSNPLCIRIDSSTNTNNNPGDAENNRFVNNSNNTVTCATNVAQNYYNGIPNQIGSSTATGVVIPLVVGNSCTTTTNACTSPSPCLPKYNRNSVTLSVPSPPHPSGPGLASSSSSTTALVNPQGNNGNSVPIPSANASPVCRTNIAIVPNNIPVHGLLPSTSTTRTLISTEAQTEDVVGVPVAQIPPPPPPTRNNREQRKRERRERRRDRNHHYSLAGHRISNNNGVIGMVGSSSHHHGHFSRHHAEIQAQAANEMNLNPSSSSSSRVGDPNRLECYDNNNTSIPDLLLNSHMPPPYSTLPQLAERRLANIISGGGGSAVSGGVHNLSSSVPLQVPLSSPQSQLAPAAAAVGPAPMPSPQHQHTMPHIQVLGPHSHHPQFLGSPQQSLCHLGSQQPPQLPPPQPVRYHFAPNSRTTRRSLRAPRGVPYASEEEPKSCCGMSTSQAVSIRWFIIIIAVIGICCTVAGTALGAARSSGSQHLTLSLLMIGVGVVLLTVSAVAWRLTANESGTSCRAMLGFARSGSSRGDGGAEPNRRFVPRLAPSYGRPHHPYAAMMYPDFQYRPPPPSYNQSMQEYRLRLLLLERSNPTTMAAAATLANSALNMVPPPPAYRPYNGTLRPCGNYRPDPDYSRPPSYRSRASGINGYDLPIINRPCLDPGIMGHQNHHHPQLMESPLHSRDPSILSYLSQQSIVADNVSMVSGSGVSNIANNGSNHHHIPGSQSVVTVMQAVSVGMDLGLDMSTLNYDHLHHHHHHHHSGCRVEEVNVDNENKDVVYDCSTEPLEEGGQVVVGEGGDEIKIQKVGSGSNEKNGGISKDGNLVRIVQTTNSSQVIGRDTVIVTVSGGSHHHHQQHQQQQLWDQSLQQPASINYSNNNNNNVNQNFHQQHHHMAMVHNQNNNVNVGQHQHHQHQVLTTTTTSVVPPPTTSSPSENNEVQILAHL